MTTNPAPASLGRTRTLGCGARRGARHGGAGALRGLVGRLGAANKSLGKRHRVRRQGLADAGSLGARSLGSGAVVKSSAVGIWATTLAANHLDIDHLDGDRLDGQARDRSAGDHV